MYKLIVSDLDRTALQRGHILSQKNREALARAKKLGVRFVPATGRSYQSVSDTLKDTELFNKEDEYVISYNGAVITENRNEKILDFQYLPFEVADEIYRRGVNSEVEIHVYTAEGNYVFRPWPGREKFFRKFWRKEVTDTDLGFLKGQKIIKMIYDHPDPFYLQQLEKEMKDLKGRTNITYSASRLMEFLPEGVDKSTAMLKLAQRLKISPEEIIALGDDFNDQEMIEKAGLGVVVQNGREALKPIADYVTIATNEEDALAEVIEKFILQPAEKCNQSRPDAQKEN